MEIDQFHDFEAFASSVRGVESKMLLRNPQNRNWTICRAKVGSLELQIGKLGSGNIACGEVRHDRLMLYQPLTADVEYKGNGVVIRQDSFFVLEPGTEFCVSTKVEHDWCALTIPTDLLGPLLFSALRGACHVASPNGSAAMRFRAAAAEFMNAAGTFEGLESSSAADSAAKCFLSLTSQIVEGAPRRKGRDGRPKLSRESIIDRSMRVLEENADSPVNVNDLATASDVSERTLRTAFNEYFGVGPNRFLQLRRLHDVRRALLKADPDATTVTTILADHGEWAMSRFAGRYRELFGELPSDTLRKSVVN